MSVWKTINDVGDKLTNYPVKVKLIWNIIFYHSCFDCSISCIIFQTNKRSNLYIRLFASFAHYMSSSGLYMRLFASFSHLEVHRKRIRSVSLIQIYIGLSVKISRCRHLQKIIVNWLVSLLSLLRQQSLLFIDYIYFNKSKSYAWDMPAKLKERKIILENFSALRKER